MLDCKSHVDLCYIPRAKYTQIVRVVYFVLTKYIANVCECVCVVRVCVCNYDYSNI